MPVSVVRTVRAPIVEEIRLTGTLRARRVSRLSSEVDGIVENLVVDDGDRVSAGDLILELDSEIARIDRARALGELAEARARHKEAQRRSDELTRLSKRQHVPQTNVDTARSEVEITAAALTQAEADLRRTDALLERHRVTAPFDGVINRKLVEVGQWVETSTALVELVETRVLRLEAPVPQFYFGRVNLGSEVAIRFDALADHIFEARITAKIPISDVAARTFPIRIELPNDAGLFAPGMSARLTVRLDDDGQRLALVVPRDAIVRKPDGTETIWTIFEEDGVTKTAPLEIKTGRIYRNNVEVLGDDLEVGTQVVVRGNEILQPGQAVIVAEEMQFEI
jgi:RND family efflux transporter MFP subunit